MPRINSSMRIFPNLIGVLVSTVLLSLAAEAGVGAGQVDGRYVNDIEPQRMSFGKAVSQVIFSRQVDKSPSAPIPLRKLDTAALETTAGPVLYRGNLTAEVAA